MPTPRIALWTPLPPLRSGIADYIVPLLPVFAEGRDLTIVIDEGYDPDPAVLKSYHVIRHTDYDALNEQQPFDLNIYQMGNNVQHLYLYNRILRQPGLVEIHDLSISMVLHHFYAGVQSNMAIFEKELQYSEGKQVLRGFLHARDYLQNEAKVNEFFADQYMFRRPAENSLGLITHAEPLTEILKDKYKAKHAYTIPLYAENPCVLLGKEVSKQEARHVLELPEDKFIIGVLGFLQEPKQNDIILKAYARLLKKYPNTHLAFVGRINEGGGYKDKFLGWVKELGLEDEVTITGYVSDEDLQYYNLASDVAITLRYPSYGQVSISTARSIASGRPVIISDIPEWRGFPDSFCDYVPVDDKEGKQLEQHLEKMVEDPALLEARSQAAEDYFNKYLAMPIIREKFNRVISEQLSIPHDQYPQGELPEDAFTWVQQTTTDITDLEISDIDDLPELDLGDLSPLYLKHNQLEDARLIGTRNGLIQNLKRIPVLGQLIYLPYKYILRQLTLPKVRRATYSFERSILETLRLLQDKLNYLTNHLEERIIPEIHELGEFSRQQTVFNQDIKKKIGSVKFQSQRLNEMLVQPVKPVPVLQADGKFKEILQRGVTRTNQIFKDTENAPIDEHEKFMLYLQEVFRGSETVVHERLNQSLDLLKDYLPGPVPGMKPILDIGFGRGELLNMLKERGYPTFGVDTNAAMVDYVRQRGHKAEEADVFDFLASQPDGAFSGIFSIHVIEHFGFEDQLRLAKLAFQKTAPGGFISLETPNPLCNETLMNFSIDPTHQRLTVPNFLYALLAYAGYDDLNLFFLQPVNVRGKQTLEATIKLYQDYSIAGRRP